VILSLPSSNTSTGFIQSADSFDPVQWLADISELLSTLPTAFGVAVDPEGARRILRECLPVPLKVIPDPEGGWTYEGTGNFEQEGLQRAMKAIKGQNRLERPHRTRFNEVGAPGVTRTPGPQFRKLLLYPPELRGRPTFPQTSWAPGPAPRRF
jgi:hypothetical protein